MQRQLQQQNQPHPDCLRKIEEAPWYVVNADVKWYARLNSLTHLLELFPYADLTPEPIVLPPRQDDPGYERPPISSQNWVPAVYGTNPGDEKR